MRLLPSITRHGNGFSRREGASAEPSGSPAKLSSQRRRSRGPPTSTHDTEPYGDAVHRPRKDTLTHAGRRKSLDPKHKGFRI